MVPDLNNFNGAVQTSNLGGRSPNPFGRASVHRDAARSDAPIDVDAG